MSRVLTKILTVGEVARIAGWSTRRMKRHLLRLDREHGNLVHRGGTPKKPHYTVTLEALEAVAPQWFRDDGGLADEVEELREVTDRLARLVGVHSQQIAELKRAR